MLPLLISNLQQSLSLPSTTISITDTTNHAQLFSNSVDIYVKMLKDPALRPPLVTVAPLMIPLILPISLAPGTGISAVDAMKSAMQYALAITAYTAAIVISPAPVMLPLGGILTPPGIVTTAKLIDLGIMTTILTDFQGIFMEPPPPGVPDEIVTMIKATRMAVSISTAYSTMTNVIISGIDSTPPPPLGIGPIPFTITGPLF
jgi:hypothetical protein